MISADYYRNASFLTSAAQIAKGPPDEGIEVAFVGRSNSGKSSAINALCAQKALARTSRTPGRTQLINFFSLDPQRKLVDLPGYGYAKVSVAIKGEWQKSLSEYLEVRNCLRGIILLMDVRHPLKDYDAQMLEWCQSRELPVHILLTKADKLNRGPAMAALQQLRSRIAAFPVPVSAQLFSALKRTGLDEAWAQLDLWFERSDAP